MAPGQGKLCALTFAETGEASGHGRVGSSQVGVRTASLSPGGMHCGCEVMSPMSRPKEMLRHWVLAGLGWEVLRESTAGVPSSGWEQVPGFEDLFLPLPRSPTLARTEG